VLNLIFNIEIKNSRELAEEASEVVPPEEVQDERGRTCSKCSNGTMITILVIDGYGNIIADKVTRHSDRKPVEIADST